MTTTTTQKVTTDDGHESTTDELRRDTTDADLGGIDETLRQAEETGNGDPHPDSLLARMKVLTPPHTVFVRTNRLPQEISKLIDILGVEAPDFGFAYQAIWTTGEGSWQPTGIYQIAWSYCPDHDNEYRLEVVAPGVKIKLADLTQDQVVQNLQNLRIVH